MEQGQIQEAAKLCPKILGRDADMWEKWVLEFARRGQLQEIGQYIPIANPKLSEMLYELVLNDYLQKDPKVHLYSTLVVY